MGGNVKILYFCNATVDVALVRKVLQNAGMLAKVQCIDNEVGYVNALSITAPDAIIYCHPAPSISLKKALDILQNTSLHIPVILIAPAADEEFALGTLQTGVSDYVLTDRLLRLPFAVKNALAKTNAEAINATQQATIALQKQTMKTAGSIAKIGNIGIDIITGARDWSCGADLIFGFEPGAVEPSFERFLALVHPEDKKRVQQEINYAFDCLDSIALDFRLITPAGQLKYIVSRMVVNRDEQGAAQTARCFIQDVTERKESDARLKSAYDDLHRLFNTIEDTYFTRDLVIGKLIQISPACQKLYGYTAAEFLADPGLKGRLTHPDFKQLQGELMKQILKGETTRAQYQIIHKDGDVKWVETKVVPGFNKTGELIRIDGVTRDITEQKNAELRLKNNEQRFRSLFENIADVVTVVDAHRRFIYANDNLSKVFGYSLAEYKQARYLHDFVHPDFRDEEQLLFDQVIENPGKSVPFSLRFKHKNGNWVWVEGTVQNLLHLESVKGIVSTYRDVTEKKNAELQLQRSEQRFRGLVENSIDVVSVADVDGCTIFTSDNIEKILGYNKAEYAVIRRQPEFIHPKDQERQRLLYIEIIANPGKPFAFSCAVKHKNGSWVWVEGTICNFINVDSIGGIVANFRDITERRKEHRALQKSQANLSAIIENTTDLVYSLDEDLNFITFNNTFKTTIKQVYGLDVEQGKSALLMLDSLGPEVAAKWHYHYSQALAGIPLRFVNEYPFDTGKVYLSYSINPIRQNAKVIGFSVFSRDITKEKQDELAVHKSEANMRSVFENTDLSINLFDIDLNLLSFNTQADKYVSLIYGKKLKIGESAFHYFPQDRWQPIKEFVKQVKGHQTVAYEIEYTIPGGEQGWMESKWIGVFDKEDKAVGVILTNKDVTEKKNAEIEREKITRDLMRRNEDLEQFTYIISHNLRAPVANIKGLADLLLMDNQNDDDTFKALNLSVGQLDNVIIDLNHILQVGKQVNDRKEQIMLDALFQEISLELSSIIHQNKVLIQYNFFDIDHIFTVKGYLYSIMQNLVVNSIKYRRPDADPVISIVTEKHGDNIVFTYTDNGKGIDLDRYGNQLFGLYKRFDFSVEGKGVGLFMVKMQVQNLGGTIAVQSQPGAGTTFTITLPAS